MKTILQVMWHQQAIFVLAMLLCVVCVGCSAGDDSSTSSGQDDDDAVDDDTPPFGDDDDDDSDDDYDGYDGADCLNAECVIEQEDAGREWECQVGDSAACLCDESYREFIEQAGQAYGATVSEAEIQTEIAAIHEGEEEMLDGLSAGELSAGLRAAMNEDWLLDKLTLRPLNVYFVESTKQEGYTEHRLILDDPLAGEVLAIYLQPDGAGPFPAVIGLHGHSESADIFHTLHGGELYPAAGIATIAISLRTMCGEETEDDITRSALLHGLNFLGMQIYELLNATRFLRNRPEIDATKIGVHCHSGGCSIANLAVRISDRFQALATDHHVNYLDDDVFWEEGWWLHHTAPKLWPYGELVNDFSSLPFSWQSFDYGYPEGNEQVVEFFADVLTVRFN